MIDPVILILGAGAASRMRGADKLTELVDGTPQLARIAQAAVATGYRVWVTLPPDRPLRLAALRDVPVQILTVPDPSEGMAASLRVGLTGTPGDAPLMLVLGDLPEITADDLRLLLAEWSKTPDLILRATAADGTPGHPVCFPAWARTDLGSLDGDQGARSVLDRHRTRVRLVALPDRHATTDLDTPEDWAAWRAARGE